MDGDTRAPLSAPPPPLPKRLNAVLRLYDAPLHRDWMFWMTVAWGVLAAASIPSSTSPSSIPVWLNTLLAVIFFVVVFGIVPSWIRLLIRRWRWRQRQEQSQPSSQAAAPPPGPEPPTGSPAADARAEPRHRSGSAEPRGGAPNAHARVVRSTDVLDESRRLLQYPVARAVRALELTNTPKDRYEAVLDAAEALTITIGITAAALFRAHNLSDRELANLQEAYLTRGVAQGTWHDLVGRLRRHIAANPDVLPGARAALDDGPDGPGIVTDLASLLQERNRAAHGSRPRDRHEATSRIAEFSVPLERALTKAQFLAGIPWILTESSSYQPRLRNFTVTVQYVMGDHPEFERRTIESSDPLPDNTFYALSPDGPVELAPFVVSRYCPACRQEEVCYADRVHKSKGTSLKSFGRGHVIFDQELDEEFRSLR